MIGKKGRVARKRNPASWGRAAMTDRPPSAGEKARRKKWGASVPHRGTEPPGATAGPYPRWGR
jgi:hypothetical protein